MPLEEVLCEAARRECRRNVPTVWGVADAVPLASARGTVHEPDGVHPKRRPARRGRPSGLGARQRRAGLVDRAARQRRVGSSLKADQPGDPLSLDMFHVGKLKGVGKAWQITACDVASSYGRARLVRGEVTAAAVIALLAAVVRPAYRQAGWPWRRVLADRGKAFKVGPEDACARWGPRHIRTRPRHAWSVQLESLGHRSGTAPLLATFNPEAAPYP